MASFREWNENKKKEEEQNEGALSFQDWMKRRGAQTSPAPAPVVPQPSTNRDRITLSHGSRFERQENESALQQAAQRNVFQQAAGVLARASEQAAMDRITSDMNSFQTKVDQLHSIIETGNPEMSMRAREQLKALQPYYNRVYSAYQAAQGIQPTNVTEEQVREASAALDTARGNALGASLRLGAALTARGQNPLSDNIPELQTAVQQAKDESAAAHAAEQEAAARYNQLAGDLQYQTYASLRMRDDFLLNSFGDAETARKAAGSTDLADIYYARIYGRNHDTEKPDNLAGDIYRHVTDDEASTFFYLWNTRGKKAATDYLSSIKYKIDERLAQQQQERINRLTESDFGAAYASAASILLNQGSIAGVVDLTLQNIRRMLGDNRPIDYNTQAQAIGKAAQQIRANVSKNLEEKYPNASLFGGAINVASFLYQTGMSMADSSLQLVMNRFGVPEPVTLSLMAGGAAQQAVYSAKERGASDGAALLTGYAAGIVEYVTEKVSLDKLVGSIEAKAGATIGEKLTQNWATGTGFQRFVRNFASGIINAGKQGGTEATEEAFATIANTFIDLALNGDKSELVQNMDTIGAEQALKNWATQLLADAMGGFISGFGMGGTGEVVRGINNVGQTAQTNRTDVTERDAPAVIEEPQQIEAFAPAPSTALQTAIDKLAAGEPLTQNDAKRIMQNAEAMQTLRDAGVLPDTVRNDSAGRQIVRQAVEQYVRQANAPTENGPPVPGQTAQAAPQIVQETPEAREGSITPPANEATTGEPPLPPAAQGSNAQETSGASGLTLPRTTEAAPQATETPRLTLPSTPQNAAQPSLTLPATTTSAAQTENDLVERLSKSKPGLAVDDYVRSKLSEAEIRAIDETAKRLGLRVAFVDRVRGGKDNARIYDSGVVLIEKGNPNPIGYLYGHEMSHWLQQNSPEAYKEFAEAARATDPEWFKAKEEEYNTVLRESGEEMSPEEIREEILCDYAGWLVDREDVLDRFIEQNRDKPNVIRRLYEAIKALAAKLTGREKQKAETAADLLLKAMNATEANVQNGIMSTGESRGQLKSPGDSVYNGDNGGEYNGQSYEGTMGETGENGRAIGGNDRGRMARLPQNQGGGSTESWAALSESKQRAIGDTAERYLNSIDGDTRSLLDRIGNPHTIAKTIWERYQENPASADWWADFIPDVYDFLNEVSDIVSSPEGNETISNTADSDGNELSSGQVSYFANSKIRDKQGRLLVLYHGTTAVFTTFDLSRSGQNYSGWSEFGEGIYLTPNAKLAQFYADEAGRGRRTRVVPYYVNLANPFSTMDAVPFAIDDLAEKYNLTEADQRFLLGAGYRLLDFLNEHHESVRDYLVAHEYDGVWDSYNGSKPNQVVAYYQNQIKDISNVNPTGDPDTMHSLKGINADIAPESIRKYGQIPKGEKPARDINVPRKVTDKEDERVSWTARTALEAKATPDAAIPGIAELVEKGAFSYNVQTDKAAIENAEATIKDKGWSAALADWIKDVSKGNVSKSNTAMGWALYNNAANAGDLDTALTVLDLIVKHQRNAAQALQASRILKQLSPEAQLYGVQRSVDNLIKELQERYGKRKNIDIQINRDLAQAFLDAKTEEERQKALEALYKDIGRQVPATFRDKWNAWRYLAMLANPRTHIRNISGNLGFAPVVFAKDQVATVLEGIASAVSKGKVERTKGLVLPVRDHDLVKAAWDRYQSVRDEALGGGKYNDSQMANRWIEEGRTIFKFKPLELARRGNSAALDAEDVWFSQPHYTYALAQYCKANGITPAQIRSGEGMGEADAYAIKEAQKATYRDINAFSDFVSSIGRTADRKTGVGKAASAVLEGVLPFRGTPANILVRGLEYSPVGLLKSLTYDVSQVMRKDADGNPRMSVAEMLDDVSEGLTGTGILLLGGLLAKLGLLRGHGEDEKKERDYYDLMGFQNYALTLPNGENYTLDWLAPESLPLFVGVNIYEKLQQSKGDMKMSDLIDVVSQISEPMLEMSMLQSLNDMFESLGYAKENELSGLTQILSSAVTSYLTQAIPTLLGQGERTGENLRMTTYTDKNKWLTKSMQYTLGKISAKVPGWDYGQVPYIDAWGRTEETGEGWVDRAFKNMVNPAYTDKIRMSDMEKELLRLYELNPEDNGSVLATSHKASKYITHNNERIDLTGEQYVTYATTKGQTAYSLMTDLVKTEEYKNASDEDKIKMVGSVYDYAATIAKGELLESLGSTYDDYEKLKAKLDKGADILDMIALTQEIKAADEAGNANSSYDTLEKLNAVEALGLPEAKAEPLLEQQLSEGQWEKYSMLKDADVNYDTRLDIMRKYSELNANEEADSGTRALEFAYYVDGLNLTSEQTQLVKDTYKFWSQVPAEAARYETFKQAGLDEDKSKHASEVLGALEPLPGKEAVTDLQRYRAIESDKTLTNAEKIKVIGSIMGPELKTDQGNPTQWAKFNLALNNGQSLTQAIDLCENGRLDEFAKWTESAAKAQKVTWDVYDKFLKDTAPLTGDKDKNGKTISGSLKEKVVAYIDSLNLTPEQKDALLTDYNSTYKHDVTWHSGSYGSSSGSGRTYARANLSRLELPRTNIRQTGRLTLPTR